MSSPSLCLLTAVGSYVIGSLPFALITGKLLKGIDIREEGSGNAGATNVYRTMGAPAAVAVLLLDFSKGLVPVMILIRMNIPGTDSDLLGILSIIFLIIGHSYPLFAGFRGGKGVAAGAGGVTALLPLLALFCLMVFILMVLITRIVSMASLVTAWSMPLFYTIGSATGLFPASPGLLLFFFFLAMGITILHRKNIGRLIRGEEPKIKRKT